MALHHSSQNAIKMPRIVFPIKHIVMSLALTKNAFSIERIAQYGLQTQILDKISAKISLDRYWSLCILHVHDIIMISPCYYLMKWLLFDITYFFMGQ